MALAEAGATIAFCYQSDSQAAEEVASAVHAASGRRPFFMRADITKPQDRKELFTAATNALGSPTILVNNAGTKRDGIAIRMGDAWEEVIDLDLTAPFRLSQIAIRVMMEQGWGRIINVGSVASRIGLAGQVNYTAAKAGLEGLTRSLAQEYGKRGITVNTVNPGFLETDLTENTSSLIKDEALKRSALQRFPTAKEVANVVTFLASDEASAMTGQTLNVDCGFVKL